jgi:hypothetical protein
MLTDKEMSFSSSPPAQLVVPGQAARAEFTLRFNVEPSIERETLGATATPGVKEEDSNKEEGKLVQHLTHKHATVIFKLDLPPVSPLGFTMNISNGKMRSPAVYVRRSVSPEERQKKDG